MNIFHKHEFKESNNDKDIIFCTCGKFKNIHTHNWIEDRRNSIESYKGYITGYISVMKCTKCGELKSFQI